MKKRIALAIMMIVVLLATTLGIGMISGSAASFVNPEPELITGTVTMPETNYLSGGDFETSGGMWLGGNTAYNTEDKIEGNRSLEATSNGDWGGNVGNASGTFANVPDLQDGQLYKFTVCFKIKNVDEISDGVNDVLLCGLMSAPSDALQVRVCTDLYGEYGTNWIKVVKYANKDMIPSLKNSFFMISGTKTTTPINVLFDAISLEIVDGFDGDTSEAEAHDPYTDDYSAAKNITVTVDKSKTYQTMEGLGFFGGMGALGSGKIYTDEWVEKVINDLGLSMVRLELGSNTHKSEDSLDQNIEYINALNKESMKKGYKVKVILSVWSPPAEFKTNGKIEEGGALKDDCYDDFAQWLVDCLNRYKTAGIEIYGLSLQNEPNFWEPYQSCEYDINQYAKLLKECVPTVKASFPNIKIFGSENMLSFEGNPSHWEGQQYHKVIVNDSEALAQLDAFSVHGYIDGVLAETIDKHKALWEYSYSAYCKNTGKSNWMTETSGYSDVWNPGPTEAGALNYGLGIGSAIKYGQVSAWCHWTGSTLNSEAKDPQILMGGMVTGKRYAASKHFYKFARPGDLVVDAQSDDDKVFATAFKNDADGTFSTVLINSSGEDKIVNLTGTGLEKVNYYVTTEDAGTNCAEFKDKSVSSIRLPKYSMVTVSVPDGIIVTPMPSNTPTPMVSATADVTPIPTVTPTTTTPTVTPTPDVKVTKVKFTKKKITLKVGKKKTLKVKLTPAKGLSKAAKKVNWSIDKKGKKAVKFVKKTKKLNGKLKVKIKAKKKGKAKVTCKAPSGKKAVCKIVVK